MLDLDMTPYAAFVWPAWAISAVVLAGLVGRAVIESRRWTAALKRLAPDDAVAPNPSAQVARSAIAPNPSAQVARSAVAPKE